MAGFALILIGMAVMLVAPLHRMTAGRRQQPPAATAVQSQSAAAGNEGERA